MWRQHAFNSNLMKEIINSGLFKIVIFIKFKEKARHFNNLFIKAFRQMIFHTGFTELFEQYR